MDSVVAVDGVGAKIEDYNWKFQGKVPIGNTSVGTTMLLLVSDLDKMLTYWNQSANYARS